MTEPSSAIHQAIQAIHDHPAKLVFEFAGAGSLALFWLHSVAGSSRTILEATDRYASTSMIDLLGAPPEKFVSRATAESMAMQAYRRARRLADAATPCLGVGCTATIATDRAKRGAHEVWVAVQDRDGVRSYGVVLVKGARDRMGEETLVSEIVVRALSDSCGIAADVPLALRPDEQLLADHTPRPDAIAMLLDGAAQSVTVHADGRRDADAPVHGGLLSGSFNPLHAGHERLAAAAAAMLNQPVVFELPVLNADKPPLSYAEVERRLAQFRWRYDVVLSRASLFVEKAALYPGCVFVIGYDTAARIVNPRYYGGEAGRDHALAAIRAHGCRFLVAGRLADGAFATLRDLAIPHGFEDLFLELPESAFRVDLSSTAIRELQQQAPLNTLS
jgi:nicotinamide mononucleotide (NMN) deamidase PncC